MHIQCVQTRTQAVDKTRYVSVQEMYLSVPEEVQCKKSVLEMYLVDVYVNVYVDTVSL